MRTCTWLLLTIIALTGCGSLGGRAAGTADTAETFSGCPVPAPLWSGERAHLPTDFVPVAAVLCARSIRRVAGRGEWTVVVVRRADTGLEPLVEALRVEDDPATVLDPCSRTRAWIQNCGW